MKKAIIVNGITDMNKGDQALVWESHRLIEDLNYYDEVKILSLGDTPEEYELLCRQSIEKGFEIIPNLLKHPRRGVHHKEQLQNEKLFYLLFQIKNAIFDYLSRSFLKLFFK